MKYPTVAALLAVSAWLAFPTSETFAAAEIAPELRTKAERGDAKAMLALARALDDAEQSEESKKWFQRAAETGLPEAELTWFNILEIEASDVEGVKAAMPFLERAAQRGFAPAQYRLGAYVLNHNLPGPEFQVALGWLKKAADQKHTEAMKEYGRHLAKGEYLPRDMSAALRYYRGAAEAGSELAQWELMEIYRDGKDRFGNQIKPDLAEALRFGRMSVRQDQFASYLDFANALLAWPNATPELHAEARKLLVEAAEQGWQEGAKQRLASLDAPAVETKPAAIESPPVAVKPEPVAPPAAHPAPEPVPIPATATATPPASSVRSREMARATELGKLEEEFAAFEKELAAATSPMGRQDNVTRLAYFLRDDLDGNALPAEAAGEWTLRKLIPILQRYPGEAFELFVELPSPYVTDAMMERVCPPDVVASIKAGARRVSENFQAQETQNRVIRQHRPAADGGDAKAQLAIGRAFLAMPNGRQVEWANAIHWLTKAANGGAPGAAAEANKLTNEVQSRYRAIVEAKDMDRLFEMNWQKAYSAMDDADKGALMAARILLGDPWPHAGMRARITNLLDLAVKKENVEAMVEYGRYYLGHPNVKLSDEAALPWFQKAAAAGNAEAKRWVELLEAKHDVAERGRRAYALGQEAIVSRSEGNNSFTDFSGARPFFRYAAAVGNGDGLAYMAGEVMDKNLPRAIAMFQKAADLGSARAMSMLVTFYRRGTGLPKDPKLARYWAIKAAETGDGYYQYTAAFSLMSGEGGAVDLAGARNYFLKGAELGHAGSMYELGVLAYDGKGTAQSDAEAFSWWTKATGKGDTGSKYRLAGLYRDGRGVAQDLAKARQLLEELIQAGYPVSKGSLEKLNQASLAGAPAASTTAAAAQKFGAMTSADLEAAAMNGDANAMFELAWRYETGDGVRQSLEKALGWFTKAADAGHPEAGKSAAEINVMIDGAAARKAAKEPSAASREIDGAAAKPGAVVVTPSAVPAKATPQGKADELLANARMFAGMGLREDAEKRFRDAAIHAETGSPPTRHVLATMVYTGTFGVPKDPARGLALLQSSADDGYVPALFDLGQAWYGGQLGFTADQTKATEYFKNAAAGAEASTPEGKLLIGLLLLDGAPGVPSDHARAARLIQSAADAGFGPAQFQMGRIKVAGLIGVTKDAPAGIALLELAWAQNVHEATMFLAEVYARGNFVPQDLAKAEKWLQRAVDAGVKQAEPGLKQVRDEIAKRAASAPEKP